MPSLTVAAEVAFALAAQEAEQLASATIDVEHLFLGLCKVEALREVTAGQVPEFSEADWHALRQEVVAFTTVLEASRLDMVRARRRLRALWREAHPTQEEFSGHRTARCRAVFVVAEVLTGGTITLAALMQAMLDAPSPLLDRLLAELRVLRERAVAAMHGMAPTLPSAPTAPGAEPGSALPTGIVSQYGRDLTQLAREGKLQPVIGREDEIKRVARILLQARKNNPLLVGDAGVGKTAIIGGLALTLLEAQAPPALRRLRLVELDLGVLVAGTKYRGEFEERVQAIVREAEADPSLVLFIGEIHMLVGAGAGSGSMDAANLLKPALTRGTLRCIGATTTREYRQHIEKDPALERRFQVVWVEEPSRKATMAILDGLRPTLEGHHGVRITQAAIEKAVDLSIRYLPDFRLPDKAIDLVDQACARAMLSTFVARPVSERGGETPAATREIGTEEIAKVVAERCRVPVERLTVEEGQRLLQMEEALGRRVMGQERAVTAVAEVIRTARAGLKDPRRPVGVFLFLGPTGTGKTELAKALAEFLFGDERRLIRIDMSEYSEKHAIAKLIGAPPGYVGHDEGGQLTDKVRTQPYAVVLFDEIEKAHPEVFDLFLQIFDEGHLTDAKGRRASFAEAVIILTSNLGSQPSHPGARRRIGIGLESGPPPEPTDLEEDPTVPDWELIRPEDLATAATLARLEDYEQWLQEAMAQALRPELRNRMQYEQRLREAVAQALRPELRNRIQKEIVFYPLGREAIAQIIDKIIGQVNARLAPQCLRVALAPSARAVLMARGYSAEFGARAMERTIHDLVEEPLGRLILQGRVAQGQHIQVQGDANALTFEVLDLNTA